MSFFKRIYRSLSLSLFVLIIGTMIYGFSKQTIILISENKLNDSIAMLGTDLSSDADTTPENNDEA